MKMESHNFFSNFSSGKVSTNRVKGKLTEWEWMFSYYQTERKSIYKFKRKNSKIKIKKNKPTNK